MDEEREDEELAAAERLARWLDASEAGSPPPRDLSPAEQEAAVMAARLRAATPAGEPSESHRAQLWQRLVEEMQGDPSVVGDEGPLPPVAPTPASSPSPAPASDAEHKVMRRDFLRWLAAGFVGLAAGAWLEYWLAPKLNPAASPHWVRVGRVSDLAVGTAATVQVEGKPYILVRGDAGLYALSGLCTHQGCTLQPQAGALICPCHGAVFEMTGVNRQGPGGYQQALPPLRPIPLMQRNDDIYLWLG